MDSLATSPSSSRVSQGLLTDPNATFSAAFRKSVMGLLLGGFMCSYCCSQSPESLDRLIALSITPASGFESELMDRHVRDWEGISTRAGLNLILEKQWASRDTGTNMACAYLLKRFSLPKEQVVAELMDKINRETKNAEPWKTVYLLDKLEAMMDRQTQAKQVIPFIAQFLHDKRFTESQYRGEDAPIRQQLRVSDGATSLIIRYFEGAGLCKRFDARFGDPGGETTWERRDKVTEEVVRVLQDNRIVGMDFWTASKSFTPAVSQPASSPDYVVKTNEQAGVSDGFPDGSTADAKPREPNQHSLLPEWLVWSLVIATAFGLVFSYRRRGRG